MKTMILVLYLVSGWLARLETTEDACSKTLEALRSGARVVATDALGRVHEVERAECIEKPTESAEVEPWQGRFGKRPSATWMRSDVRSAGIGGVQ